MSSSRVPFEKPDREGHKHPGFGTLASQTLGAAALAERLLRQVTKSRELFWWVLFVVESVEEKERGAQSNDAVLNQSFSAGHTELKHVTLEHSPPDPAEKPLVNSKEPRVQDVDRQGIHARVQLRVQQRRSMLRCSLLRAAPKTHPHRTCRRRLQLVELIADILKTRPRLKLVMFLQA